jgi:phosphohistidine swiveling domain-containing protein
MNTFILPLSDPRADLATVGGKGMSLAKLARAGLPVPGGFHITTAAYREFVAANGLQPHILEALKEVESANPGTLETTSLTINQLFAEATIPAKLVDAITQAYANLSGENPAVAVRSSATAEDLPEASFAGQQETFLNMRGTTAVLEAVRSCWASLWTARAIAYRLRQGIAPENVALAVVVQELVPAEAAGILFTANPLNGRRSELVINAAWGLGEAIVGGVVTPDAITIEKNSLRTVQRVIAVKLLRTVCNESGTEEQPVPERMKKKAVLNDKQATELARLGTQIEQLYDMPMDIEWAWTSPSSHDPSLHSGQAPLPKGKAGFTILQARPITALPEAPLEWKLPLPNGIYMRTGVVDLMPNPLSPLYATLGIPTLVAQTYPLARQLIRMEPVLPEGYFTTINNYAYMNAHFSGRAWMWILFGMLPAYPRLLRILVPFWRDESHPQYQKAVHTMQEKDIEKMTCAELWQATQTLMDAVAIYTSALMFATMGASAGSEGLLTKVYEKMARREGDPPATALLMGWDNLPVRAEKSLYDLAKFCQEHEKLKVYVLDSPANRLVIELTGEQVPLEIKSDEWLELKQRFNRHLDEFGYMVFELDFATPLPRDHPEPMLENVKMYLRGEGVNPYERQKASELKRIQTAQNALARLKGFRRWAFSKALKWGQSLSEVREDALADIGLGYPLLRGMLHLLGEHLANAGALKEVGDIFWLEKDEVTQAVTALEGGAIPENMLTRVEQRKAFWQKAKATVPPPMLPPRKKYLGINTTVWLAESEASQTGKTLKGVPASPGQVTARARVLHDVTEFQLFQPGEVLVAGTTTPAWTPLFAMASAIVTDIGGPLSHGSIVAREYGIPAVMGTGVATRRIKDGETITVDGSKGLVTIL